MLSSPSVFNHFQLESFILFFNSSKVEEIEQDQVQELEESLENVQVQEVETSLANLQNVKEMEQEQSEVSQTVNE